MHEEKKIVTRSLWIATCQECGRQKQDEHNRGGHEWYCMKCRQWWPYKKTTYTGTEL